MRNGIQLNGNSIGRDVNGQQVGRDINAETINNGGTINNTINNYYPKLKTNKDSQDKANGSLRPYLADRYGEKVKVTGLCICQYRHFTNRYTVINVMDYSTNYVADHIQIDIPENLPISINKMIGKQVVVIGKVLTYLSNYKPNGEDYKIEVIDIYPLDSICICNDEPQAHKCCLEDVRDQISLKTPNEIYDLIEIFRRKLNTLTGCFGQNYVFNYIISQYMLNTCSIDLYESGLSVCKLNDEVLVDILILVTSSLNYIWRKDQELSLYMIMKRISEEVSVIQGIWTYATPTNLEEFCNTRLGLGKRKARTLSHVIYNRKLDFGEIDKDVTIDKICAGALRIINTELKITEG